MSKETDESIEWIERIIEMMQNKMSGNHLSLVLDRNITGIFDVECGLISIETSLRSLKKEIAKLEEYKWMYEGLSK